MRELNLSHNKLREIPPSFVNLENLVGTFATRCHQVILVEVDFSGCWLSSIPEELRTLSCLTQLVVANNKLSGVCGGFLVFHNLRYPHFVK